MARPSEEYLIITSYLEGFLETSNTKGMNRPQLLAAFGEWLLRRAPDAEKDIEL